MEQQEKTLWERLKYTYRLIIMNDETFEEVGSYRLSLLNVYVVLSTIVVAVALMMWMLIIYTPLKRYIPGYSGVSENTELIADLEAQVALLEEERKNRDFYIDNIKRILAGNVEYAEDVQQEPIAELDADAHINADENERNLRKQVEKEEMKSLSIIRANQSPSKPLEQSYFITPVLGEVIKGFDKDQRHFGTDIVAPSNTPIKAVMDGRVFFADWTMETGNVIGIQHANNLVTFYKHNSMLLKEVGNFVKAGEAVAVIGNTGTKTSGPHLHFELWHNGKVIDAAEYFTFY
ncbi:MAG: M23 family metallopeptidase [Bacteroidota bacterium]